jgi:hypothetical protein
MALVVSGRVDVDLDEFDPGLVQVVRGPDGADQILGMRIFAHGKSLFLFVRADGRPGKRKGVSTTAEKAMDCGKG